MANRGRAGRAPEWRRTLIPAIAAAAIAMSLAGCLPGRNLTASATGGPGAQDGLRADADSWGRRYGANPGEKTASLAYARALGTLGQKDQAKAVLQVAAIKSPKDQEVLAAYGKALVDVGEYDQALGVLARAHSPDRPDWRILSAEGIASDGVGMHERAQSFYLAALRIQPGDPGVMSNLGLSYALSKKLPEAERMLSEAAQNPKADPRVRQNLALVLALQGRFDNATQTLRHDLSPADAATNVAEIRAMIDQPNTWDAIRGKGLVKELAQAKDPRTTAITRRNDAGATASQDVQAQISQ
ncbi:Flp pilus assembly protein TadD, contains TPR repeats [Rhizobiales bacterium GAS188]|nr:Flp pilus assembly protein TadD, contains TPR repeats [Rhizobiales bacterium GAS188]